MFYNAIIIVSLLFGSSRSFLWNPTSFTHPPTTHNKVYQFDFEITEELSLVYTKTNGVQVIPSLENGEYYYIDEGVKTKINASDLVTLDGVPSKYIAINGQFPGPTIEVPLGAEVYVHVHNNLISDSATVHWHGLTMRKTQWADGSPYVTQCPILPHTSFTYRFIAGESGVFWYHSHMDMQRMDGLFGAIIVHDPKKPSPEGFTVQVNDWLHMDGTDFATTLLGEEDEGASFKPIPDRYSDVSDDEVGDLAQDSFLVNGRGRYKDNSAPLTIHRVKVNQQYLFRFINTGFDNMYEISIDGHKLKVIATDSCDVEPVVVDSVFLAIGERVSVIVEANQTAGNYWVRYRAPHKSQKNLAYSILSYSEDDSDPVTSAKICTDTDPCVALNCPFSSAPNWSCIPIHELKSTEDYKMEIDKIRSNDKVDEHFLAYSYMAGDTINGRALVLPPSPFYQQDYKNSGVACDEDTCNKEGCACTNVRKLPSNTTVQLVVMHQVLKHFIHTWHMHGYRFAVLKVVYPPKNDTTHLIQRSTDIKCSNALCHDAQWSDPKQGLLTVDRPPIKDTVLIPVGGYAIVRIYTDNPGYWMGHCHQTEHLHEGMAMIFDVDGELAKENIPNGFPTCGNFKLKP